VKGEEDQITAIEANPDQYVDERYRDELEGRGLGLFDHPRRQGGNGPGGPGGPNKSDGQGTNDKTPKRDPKP